MEVMVETKTYLVHMQCEKCGKGYMLDETPQEDVERAMITNQPIQYIHRCNNKNCGHEEKYETSYPYPTLIPVDEIIDKESNN